MFILKNKKNVEGEIRTPVPVTANGFQDRLVMTTSIPLHKVRRPRLELGVSEDHGFTVRCDTNSAHRRKKTRQEGFEPPTNGSGVHRSTNWNYRRIL